MTQESSTPPRWVRWLVALYPPGFRRRYRRELHRSAATLLSRHDRRFLRLRLLWDLVCGAALQWLERAFRIESPLEHLTTMVHKSLRELRLAFRRLGRSPAFAAIAIATVALAVGANTAVFTLVNGVLLQPMPYERPDELGFVWSGLDWIGVPRAWIAGPQIPFLRQHADRFEDFAALRVVDADLTPEQGMPGRRVAVGTVTGNLFSLLGIEAELGRTLAPEEEGPDAPAVTVLTHELWRDALGGDEGVVGQEIRLEGSPFRVVGVLPPDFRFAMHSSLGDPRSPDLYVPLDDDFPGLPTGNFAYALLGRVTDAAHWGQAVAELDALGSEFGRQHYRRDDFRFRLVALHPDLVKDVRPALLMLMGAVGLVLAIACSNVATLVLGRSLAGRREVAVRGAIGASSWSRLRPSLLEAGLVAAIGGTTGVVLAYGATDLLLALAPADLPRSAGIRPDWRVLSFSLGATTLVAMTIAAVPAWQLRRLDLTAALRQGGRGASDGRGFHKGLVVAQVALCGVLLVSASLLGRSLLHLMETDPGFAMDGVQMADVRIPDYLYEDDVEAVAAFEQIRATVRSRPDVSAVGWTGSPPLSGLTNQRPYHFGRAPAASGNPEEDEVLTDSIIASPGYFEAAGIEVVAGRGFTSTDTADSEPVVVIDETLAERFWPAGAVGGEVLLQWSDQEVAARVVGVIRHARLYDIRTDDRFQVYRPLRQQPARQLTLAVRTDGTSSGARAAISSAIREVDPRLGVSAPRSVRTLVRDALSSWRFLLQLLGAFATVALLLAALGLYGVVSLSVTRRTHAIGVRMALGARTVEIGRSVIGQGLRLVIVGLAAAAVGAWSLGRLLGSFLYGVSPMDPASLIVVGLMLAAVATLASWLPARRAANISPVEAFRSE